MDAELLEKFHWFNDRTKDPAAAAILAAASILAPQPKRTGLTIREAAEYLGVSKTTITRLCQSGQLRRETLGGRLVRFNASDLDAVRSKQKSDAYDPHARHFR